MLALKVLYYLLFAARLRIYWTIDQGCSGVVLAWVSFDPRFKNFIRYTLVLDVRWKDKSGNAYERPRKQQKQHSQKRKKEQQEQLQSKVRTVCTHVLCIQGTACGVGGVLLCTARILQPSAISCLYVWTHWPGFVQPGCGEPPVSEKAARRIVKAESLWSDSIVFWWPDKSDFTHIHTHTHTPFIIRNQRAMI